MSASKKAVEILHKGTMKVAMVGNYECGISTFGMILCEIPFPDRYSPIINESYDYQTEYKGKDIFIKLWDTSGNIDFERLRPLSYSNADACLVFFSIFSPESFENARNKWIPEAKHYCPDVPAIFVGSNYKSWSKKSDGLQPIPKVMIEELKRDTGAAGYFEFDVSDENSAKKVIEDMLDICMRQDSNDSCIVI